MKHIAETNNWLERDAKSMPAAPQPTRPLTSCGRCERKDRAPREPLKIAPWHR